MSASSKLVFSHLVGKLRESLISEEKFNARKQHLANTPKNHETKRRILYSSVSILALLFVVFCCYAFESATSNITSPVFRSIVQLQLFGKVILVSGLGAAFLALFAIVLDKVVLNSVNVANAQHYDLGWEHLMGIFDKASDGDTGSIHNILCLIKESNLFKFDLNYSYVEYLIAAVVPELDAYQALQLSKLFDHDKLYKDDSHEHRSYVILLEAAANKGNREAIEKLATINCKEADSLPLGAIAIGLLIGISI